LLLANDKLVDLSIVIVSYNTKELTRHCLECIKKFAKDISHEVLVTDNSSIDGSADMVAEEFPWVRLIRLSENRGFAGGNIPGMKNASGKYILLLNSDAFLSEGVLHNTISHMDKHHEIGILGCSLINSDGTLQPSARMLPSPLNKILQITGLAAHFPKSRFFGRADFTWWDHSVPRSVGWVVGAFFLIRRKTMEELGFLDDRYFLYFEEVDYCLSAKRAGWKVVFYPHAHVVHLTGQSAAKSGQDITEHGKQIKAIRIASEFRYYRKLYGWFFVLLSASIEYLWCLCIITRNFFKTSDGSITKKREAINTMQLIIATLKKNNWGKI
jgi:N-acetylglucosaminyl-diphospho-decaprenol L-rhamnosyltransferase